jgi:hypothetical protein
VAALARFAVVLFVLDAFGNGAAIAIDIAMIVDEADHVLDGRSSSAWAK